MILATIAGNVIENLCNGRFPSIILQILFSPHFSFFSLPVCKAGYFKSGGSCIPCSGNEIKSTPGDATDCTADPPCDGATKVPNDDHTACGE